MLNDSAMIIEDEGYLFAVSEIKRISKKRTSLDPSRRLALKMGMAAVGLPLLGKTNPAEAAPQPLSVRKFDRGINAWPWFSFPTAFPSANAAYSVWPPYNPNRPVPRSADLAMLAAPASISFDFQSIRRRYSICWLPIS